MNKKPIEIYTDFITLGQFLKIADLISTGGEAKTFLLTTKILVNGEEENRRGRKLRENDEIIVKNQSYLICKKC